MLEIYVDADACPVKDEVYRVARRYGLRVWVVTNGQDRSRFLGALDAVIQAIRRTGR